MALVAKSYEGLNQICEPYMVNGRMYVKVEMGNGNVKQVRAYSAKEYEKFYHVKPVVENEKTQKEVLGFKNGYITIFKGDTYSCKDWFKENGARYTRLWGWSFSSEMEVPADLPAGVEAMRLEWDVVGDGDSLKSDDTVKAVVEAMTFEPDESEYQGEVGQRLELEVVIEKAIRLDGYYGPSTMHIMRDADGNAYVWTTASKSWEEGAEKHIRGTVKDHKTYHNVKQTVLSRCAEVKTK